MNIIKGIILIIFEYQKQAKWSNIYKGTKLKLLDDDSKVICIEEDYATPQHSVRANFCIDRGQIVIWQIEFAKIWSPCNFVGVVSSKVTDFNANPCKGMKYAYGIDDDDNRIFNGNETIDVEWDKPAFPPRQTFTIKVIADWTGIQCKLTFFYDGDRLNKTSDCTMELPELEDDVVLYPCVTPFNKDAYCIIKYA